MRSRVFGTIIFSAAAVSLGACASGASHVSHTRHVGAPLADAPTSTIVTTTTLPPLTAPPTTAPAPPSTQAVAPAPSFANCAEARAAGAAPLYRGQPGYSSRLDRDGDGVACE